MEQAAIFSGLRTAQHLSGEADVLKGESSVIQMPTSAGKTKATELIIRSGFLAQRIKLAIVIAPFRALCHEIKNSMVEAFQNEPTSVDELTDVLQADFDIEALLGHQQILIVTPEKLLYVLRREPELASHVGLLVFDEGHQFDSGTRGITYELLLTSLRSMIPPGVQKLLISAVISNANAVGEWLNGMPNVVHGTTLVTTFRSVGFVNWPDKLGRIQYVDSQDPEEDEFFVPRVIERFKLDKKKRERKDRFFPDKFDGRSIAIYLGLKLIPNGSIAIFCGTKSTAASICEKAVDVIERGSPLTLPLEHSDQQEVKRLAHLYAENLGVDAPASQSATHGIFSHHGNTPHGIRLGLEYAMREDYVRFIVCTSTLAQGVNLPIRYLVVTSVYQGRERIKVRDFHNLIGRAGRAGMHTEGSVLFADPVIYQNRKAPSNRWRWEQVKELLEPRNSEPCISNLLSIFEPIMSDDNRYRITIQALDFCRAYVNDPGQISRFAAEIVGQHEDKRFSQGGVERQIAWRISLISAIESFLLSHWDETNNGLSEIDVVRLAEGTLAFYVADDERKEDIRELFTLLAENILANVTDPVRRNTYGRTLYGVYKSQAIEEWVQSNAASIRSIVDESEALDLVWPVFTQHINGGIFTKFDEPEVLKEIARGWIDGKSFYDLMKIIFKRNTRMVWGKGWRKFKIDHVVDLCEGTLAYDGTLLVGAICEFVEMLNQEVGDETMSLLQLFQTRLKYGLPTAPTIALYQLGFSDRVISQDLANSLNISTSRKTSLVEALKQNRDASIAVIKKYPSYFQKRLNELLNQ